MRRPATKQQWAERMASAAVEHSGYTPVSGDLSGQTLIEAMEPFAALMDALLVERALRTDYDALDDPKLAAAVERTEEALEYMA